LHKILENGPNFGADVTPLNINIFRKKKIYTSYFLTKWHNFKK